MGKRSKPTAGSHGVYPRKRAKSIIAKFKSFKCVPELKVLNFYGYKAGMLHVIGKNKHKGSALLNQKVAIPATVVEFPPLTVFGVRFYSKKALAVNPFKEYLFYDKADKEISRRITGAGRAKVKGDLLKKANDCYAKNKDKIVEIKLIVHTNPKLTTIGKKAPEVVELSLSGNIDEKFNYFKSKLGINLEVGDVFNDLEYLDCRGVTIGKGFQGVIKRYGVKRRSHKAEKGPRKVGSIGPWSPPLVMWTVPRPGQVGFHTRTHYNTKVLKTASPEDVSNSAGWEGYGRIKNNSLIMSGSLPGPVKRLVTFRAGIRPVKDIKNDIAEVTQIVM